MATGGDAELSRRVQTMQVIAAALLAGIAVFMGLAIFMRQQGPMRAQQLSITYVGLALAAVSLFTHVFVANQVAAAGRRRMVQERLQGKELIAGLCGVYQTRFIVAAALLEGAAFLCLIGYLLEGDWAALAAAVVLWAAIAIRFPTRAGVEDWLVRQQEQIDQERAGG